MLEEAPFAIPMPARILMDHQLAVFDIPAAILLNSYSGDFDVRTSPWLPGIRQAKTKPSTSFSNNLRFSEGSHRLEIDMKRLRSTSDISEPLVGRAAAITSSPNDRMALIRSPRAETNKGRNPKSRRYIHGVLHNRPWSVAAGAVVTILIFVITPLAVISSLLLLLSREMSQNFGWVPGWVIVFPLSLPVFGFAYLTWGLSGFCRICGQRLFRHGSHRKSPRAHHIRGFGHIIPLCVHILLFRWFRCTHCGTSIRLKE
jgi:hypothetical protein